MLRQGVTNMRNRLPLNLKRCMKNLPQAPLRWETLQKKQTPRYLILFNTSIKHLSLSDGEGAVVKNHVTNLVKAGGNQIENIYLYI
jgi:hypothetical protein